MSTLHLLFEIVSLLYSLFTLQVILITGCLISICGGVVSGYHYVMCASSAYRYERKRALSYLGNGILMALSLGAFFTLLTEIGMRII